MQVSGFGDQTGHGFQGKETHGGRAEGDQSPNFEIGANDAVFWSWSVLECMHG